MMRAKNKFIYLYYILHLIYEGTIKFIVDVSKFLGSYRTSGVLKCTSTAQLPGSAWIVKWSARDVCSWLLRIHFTSSVSPGTSFPGALKWPNFNVLTVTSRVPSEDVSLEICTPSMIEILSRNCDQIPNTNLKNEFQKDVLQKIKCVDRFIYPLGILDRSYRVSCYAWDNPH